MNYSLLIYLFLILCNPLLGQEEKSNPPRIAVKVPQGEAVVLKGHQITFAEVLEDSRCPANVDCVWAGQVVLQVQVTAPDGSRRNVQLTFKGGPDAPVELPVLIENAEWKLCGLNVQPYPQDPGEKMAYVLLISSFEKAQ